VDFYQAIKTKALLAVLAPDLEAHVRHVQRFYSKTFHVPLRQVQDLSDEEVFQAYYEEVFEQMSPEERQEYIDELTETPEERAAREKVEKKVEVVDDEFYKKLNAEVQTGQRKGPPKGRVKLKPPEPVLLPPPPEPLPDISMKFGDNLLEEVGDLDPLSPLPPPKG
jgi:hypothetical protein